MNLILYLSEAVFPILVLLIVGNGLMHRQHVYEDFLEGAKSGIRTAVEIMPTLIGLMAAVGILRASGFLDFISGWLGKLMAATGFPTELIPVAVVKMFSSSAATGLLLDIYKTHVGLFYVGKSKKDKIYTSGSPFCNHCRNCGKCISCVENLKL